MRTYLSLVADSRRWQGFEHRDGDIVISTPSKAGTTWTQMLVALLVFDGPDFPDRLAMVSPWLEADFTPIGVIRERLAAQEHRRFIKTHVPLDGLPLDERVTYLVVGRDPRDVWLSMGEHGENLDYGRMVSIVAANLGEEEFARRAAASSPYDTFAAAVAAPAGSSPTAAHPAHVLHHLRTGWDRRGQDNLVLMHYAHLRSDVAGEMAALARLLGFAQSDARIRELADHSSFGRMRERAEQLAPEVQHGGWKSPTEFFRAGRMRAWAHDLTAEDLQAYDARATALHSDAAFLSWAHGGRAGCDWRV